MSKKRKHSVDSQSLETFFAVWDKKNEIQPTPHLRYQILESFQGNKDIEMVEQSIFDQHKENKHAYLYRMQQLSLNFQLNKEFLSSFIHEHPELFIMTTNDFLCKGTQLEKDRIQEHENILENQNLLKKTDIFGSCSNSSVYCSQCLSKKNKKTEVYSFQMQTRGGDEPMTRFFFCTECGKRWKQ